MKRQNPMDLWPAGARIIEFGVRDGALGKRLLAAGFQYLGVVESRRQVERLALRHPRLAPHLAACRERNRVRQNNAEVLILNGGMAAHLGRFRDVRHAQFVACPVKNGPLLVWTLLFWLGQFLLSRLAWPCWLTIGETRLLVSRVRRPIPYTGTRRFIPHALGIAGFFEQLRGDKTRHIVLRWFESLPEIRASEDLDLIVRDESLPVVWELLDRGPGLQAVDLYSTHGAPGADYQKLPYYPPHLAEQLLARSVVHNDLCCVPSPRDHFLSLTYHALYHKGLASGVPSSKKLLWKRSRPDHDYAIILKRMAIRLGITAPITLEDLDAYLDAQGWRPPQDMLVRLSHKNAWLRSLLRCTPKKVTMREVTTSRAA